MAKSQDDRTARTTRPFKPRTRGRVTTQPRGCTIPVGLVNIGGRLMPTLCGDRVLKAGRCAEHFADWKHEKESRRAEPAVVTAHRDGRKNHGDGTSASAIQNRKDRAARLMRRRAAWNQRSAFSLWSARRTLARAFKHDPTFRLPTPAEERSFRTADRIVREIPSEPTHEDAIEFHRHYDALLQHYQTDERFQMAQLCSWAVQQTEGRVFTSERDVLAHLCRERVTLVGHALGLVESEQVREAARVAWRGLETATCRNPTCGRTYVRAEGSGITCSPACMIAEMEAS